MDLGSPTFWRAAWLRRVAWVALALMLGLAPLCVRVGVEGRGELARADAAATADDREAEIRALGRAARWRLPILRHDEQARARLASLARAAEREGSLGHALAAWQELRSALLGTRSLGGVADPDLLIESNEGIARVLEAQAERAGETIAIERIAVELGEPPATDSPRTRIAALAFVAWIACVIGFVSAGIDEQGRLRPRPALRWAGAGVLLLVTWILLM